MNLHPGQALAERMNLLLQQAVGCGVDAQRMLHDPLYARDVLLVCDAHRGSELAALAQQYRALNEAAPLPGRSAAARSVRPDAPADGRRAAAPAPALTPARAPARDGTLSSFFGRFRPSAPATLPPARDRSPPANLGLDSPDTWPPEADSPLDASLQAPETRPRPVADRRDAHRVQRRRSPAAAWFSPSRWFSRGPE